MGRIDRITEVVRNYDRDLFAEKDEYSGLTWIKRKAKKWVNYNIDNDIYRYLVDDVQFVFPLTETWSVHGKPVEWGLDVIRNKLVSNDLWNNPHFMEEFERSADREQETKRKDFQNSVESFLYESRSIFKKGFDHINTSLIK